MEQQAEFAHLFSLRGYTPTYYIRGAVTAVSLAMAAWFTTTASAATIQNFNVAGGGTPYCAKQTDKPPGPEVMNGGPTGAGKFLRLAPAAVPLIETPISPIPSPFRALTLPPA